MTTIRTTDYNIYLGDYWNILQQYLERGNYARTFIIVDENTKLHCLPALLRNTKLKTPVLIETKAGERNKNITTCQTIWQTMMKNGGGRRDITLNLGGGVIGDMGGFCAATFKRGMDFIQIPTTLLSQVDASVGGKLGIDFGEIKNSIGLFKNPLAVMIWPGFLETLPDRELKSGYAEIIKHALIADHAQWEILYRATTLDRALVPHFLQQSISIKENIVATDPFESGMRKALNFGHTIGHAIESDALPADDFLLHGEAIAIGMICESYLSNQAGHLSDKALEKITQFLLQHYGKTAIHPEKYPRLLELMRQDKKNDTHRINFTMLKSPGEALINQFASDEMIIKSLVYYQNQESTGILPVFH